MVSAVVVLIILIVSIRGFQDELFTEKYLFDTSRIYRGSGYYRFITAGFLHGNYAHLLFNLMSFYSFATVLEHTVGVWQLLLLFIGSIIGGNLLAFALHKNHEYRALGASGGVSGIIFAVIFLSPGGGIGFHFIPVYMPSFLYALLFLGVSIWGIRSQSGNIGHDAHLGGALVGLLLTTLLRPRIVVESPLLYFSVVLICALFFWYLHRSKGLQLTAGTTPFSNTRMKIVQRAKKKKEKRIKHITLSVDEILRKVNEKGIQSLTAKEKAILKEGADYYRTRGFKS